jgi:pyruvate kinase
MSDQLEQLHRDMLELERRSSARIGETGAALRASAANLVHYLEMRRRDMRVIQDQLAQLGLSSLGRAESHIAASVEVTLQAACALQGRHWHPESPPAVDFARGRRLLHEHAEALLGPAPAARSTRIMVTMPSEAAHDYALVLALVTRGMDCMRINCAHDDVPAWQGMIDNLRRAEREAQRSCRLLMDLAGPKLRTGALKPGPAVLKLKPERDAYGRVLRPARIWLGAREADTPAPPAAAAAIRVPQRWLQQLKPGDPIQLHDARDAARHWTVRECTAAGCWAESDKTSYLSPRVRLHHKGGKHTEAAISGIPAQESHIELQCDDILLLTAAQQPGQPARRGRNGKLLQPAAIACVPPQVLDDLREHEPIWFDDGRIGGHIEKIEHGVAQVRITHLPGNSARLRAEKGINLPQSRLSLPALTDKDLSDLAFVVQHADMVGLSFVNRVDDVRCLQREIDRLGSRRPAIVLKIETQQGFLHSPALLLAAMRDYPCGLMIARGDLAVECGFERLAEVQEELLCLCEAAHVPVIWATQVLESLAKLGLPSRGEISDAAMGHRAECVMLNKGPHMVEACAALDDILRRMQGHQNKKSAQLRALHLAAAFAA